MSKFLDNIRQKSDEHKNKIIWVTVLIAIAIMLIVWIIAGNGQKLKTNTNFFQNFNKDLQEGKNTLPANINSNTNQ